MTFTTTPPTAPGFYAWRYSGSEIIRLAELSQSGDRIYFKSSISDRLIGSAVDCCNFEWCRLVPAEEVEKADAIIADLLMSSDSSWYKPDSGHDWKEAVDVAESYLFSRRRSRVVNK